MNTAIIDVGEVDWEGLREQKQDLMRAIENTNSRSMERSLTGILHFLDHIQDQADGELGGEIVFGPEEE